MSERSDEVETIETEMLWGALSSDVMEPLGAPAAVASVLLRPSSIPVELMEQMHALIPVEVLPKEGRGYTWVAGSKTVGKSIPAPQIRVE